MIALVPLSLPSADHPFDVYIAGVLTLGFFCAVVAAVTGLAQGHQPGARSLNFWDEVLAYCLTDPRVKFRRALPARRFLRGLILFPSRRFFMLVIDRTGSG